MEMTAVFMRWHFAQLSVLEMHKPQHITFSKDMRKHLLKCFTRNEMEPFPGEKVTRKKRVKETVMLEIICTCRSIEDGNMVECEVCKEWFHQGCLTVPQSVCKNLQHHGCVIHARKSRNNSRNIVVCIQK